MTSPKITPARRQALSVLVSNTECRTSNETNRTRGFIYWQTAQWLTEHGYAMSRTHLGTDYLTATPKGIEKADQEGCR